MDKDSAKELQQHCWGQASCMKLFATGQTKNLEDTQKRVDGWEAKWHNKDPFAGMEIRKQTGEYLGYIVMGYGAEENSSEIAYMIREEEWGKGYGYEALGTLSLFLSE